MNTNNPITSLLQATAEGNAEAQRLLWAAVHAELRQMAALQMAQEAPGRTLQPTALVNELYLRMFGNGGNQSPHGTPFGETLGIGPRFENRRHFFGAAARAMHQILVDDARRRGRLKRGGDCAREQIEPAEIPVLGNSDPLDLIALDQALEKLERERPDLTEVVRHRFFLGLSLEETADVLGVARRTVVNHWQLARAMLFGELTGESALGRD